MKIKTVTKIVLSKSEFGLVKTIRQEDAMEAVKKDSSALQYVHEQTVGICMEAVKQDGYALRYVHEQTVDICMEAVKQDSSALPYVDARLVEIENQSV